MEKTAAIVVTYNRVDCLKQCVAALQAQICPCDILVVDNGSIDATAQWVAQYMAGQINVFYRNTGKNTGGAGGFHCGIQWAVSMGYETLWLMDDDCYPKPDALEKLLQADRLLNGEYGWLSSIALWTDGTECKMNRQKLKKSFYEYSPLLKYGLVQAEQATFVSLFLRTGTVCKVGNVIADYFIWGDDIEYTRRIAVREKLPCFAVGQSQVVHAMKENNGSSIATDSPERLGRYRYAFRNEAHLYRQEGFKGVCCYLAKCGVNAVRILRVPAKMKGRRFGVLLVGFCKGLAFHPQTEMIKKQGE